MLLISRRLAPTLTLLLTLGITGSVASTLAGCEPSAQDKGRNCKVNDTPRVAANRVPTFYAWNYIYADEQRPGRNEYIAHATAVIQRAYDQANGIFKQRNINLQVVSLKIDPKHVQHLDQLTINDLSPDPPVSLMVGVHKDPNGVPLSRFIGVHWPRDAFIGLGSSGTHIALASVVCSNDNCNWAIMGGYIQAATLGQDVDHDKIARDLAMVLTNYFGLNQSTGPSLNLMNTNGGPTAVDLTDDQRSTLSNSINSFRPNLLSRTCDPPIEVAPGGNPTP